MQCKREQTRWQKHNKTMKKKVKRVENAENGMTGMDMTGTNGVLNVAALYGGSTEEEEREEKEGREENAEIGENEVSEERNMIDVAEETREDAKLTVEEMIAAAEERGYLRGLNAAAESEMAKPGLWQTDMVCISDPDKGQEDPVGRFLSARRRSAWDE